VEKGAPHLDDEYRLIEIGRQGLSSREYLKNVA
jgi:hypothetical protein